MTKKKKAIYKYKHWDAFTQVDDIIEELESLYIDGWKVVSHNQNPYGMSVILLRKPALEL